MNHNNIILVPGQLVKFVFSSPHYGHWWLTGLLIEEKEYTYRILVVGSSVYEKNKVFAISKKQMYFGEVCKCSITVLTQL